MVRYEYSTLTSALDDPLSPLHEYLWRRFPFRREIQEAYRAGAGPIQVPRSPANPGTLGTAFDLAVAYAMNPAHLPSTGRYLEEEPQSRDVVDQLRSAARLVDRHQPLTEEQARMLWALALCVEVHRMGTPYPGSTIDEALNDGTFTADRIASSASMEAVSDLQAMHGIAVEALYPQLPAQSGEVEAHTAVTFVASSVCRADADLVVDGLLLEVKTRLGRKTSTGYADILQILDLYQAVGYLLFDLDDRYSIRRVGWYSARYGNLAIFDVGDLLRSMADGPRVDLAEERERVWELLGLGRSS